MKLKAIGEFIVLEDSKTKVGKFTMTETHKGKVISVGEDVKGIVVGDEVYYQPNKIIKLGDFFAVHMNVICCKVDCCSIEDNLTSFEKFEGAPLVEGCLVCGKDWLMEESE